MRVLVGLLALLLVGAGPAAPAEPPVVRVRLTNQAGVITLAIDVMHAPLTARNFRAYVDDGRLDGTRFFRAWRCKGAPRLGFVQGWIDTDARQRASSAIEHFFLRKER